MGGRESGSEASNQEMDTFLYRLTAAALAGVLLLVLAGCAPTLPAPLVPPTPIVSPLPAESSATAQPESTPSALESPLAAPTAAARPVAATPNAGKASVVGRLIDFKTSRPMANQNLSLPAIVCPDGVAEENKRDECVYVVDEAFDPSALTDEQGWFVFKDITAGEYVILVGNPTTRSVVLTDDFNQPLIWKAEADKVLELGDLVVELP